MAEDDVTYSSKFLKLAKVATFLLVIIVAGYFYLNEFKKNSLGLSQIKLTINAYYLTYAMILCLLSYLLEIIIWKLILNKQPGCNAIKWREIAAILYSSGFLRYVPGRIWSFAAQTLWLKKYGIANSMVMYINAVYLFESILVSLYFGLLYLAIYTSALSSGIVMLSFASLLLANILCSRYNNVLLNKLFVLVERMTKVRVQAIDVSPYSMFVIQLVVTVIWGLTGFAAYYLAKGFGLHIVIEDTIPVIASMSLSWLAGYLAFVSPGGLGVREGMMLLMLKPVLAVQTTLLLPILSRVMLLLSEAILGLLALVLGLRHDVFSFRNNDGVR